MSGLLRVVQGPDLGKEYPLVDGEMSAGRDPEHAICLTDRSASRTHFLLQVAAGRVKLVDMRSRNRTRVNGEPVAEHLLRVGDEISVGRTRLVFILDVESSPDAATPPTPSLSIVSGESRSAGLEQAETVIGLAERMASWAREELRAARTTVAWLDAPSGGFALGAGRDDSGRPLPESPLLDPDSARACVSDPAVRSEPRAAGRTLLTAPLLAEGRVAGVIQVEAPADALPVESAALLAGLGPSAGALFVRLREREAARRAHGRQADARRREFRFLGDSRAAAAIRCVLTRAGACDSPVLLHGEPGTGKRHAARAIHEAGARADGPFVALSCAEGTPDRLAAALFGSTGSPGALARAQGGSLVLTEVDYLAADTQAHLVRVLANGALDRREPGEGSLPWNARLICTSGRDLDGDVQAGRFRQDLYFRLSVLRIHLPPLRERPADVPALARAFLAEAGRVAGRHPRLLTPEAEHALAFAPWPNNALDLRTAIAAIAPAANGEPVRPEHLPPLPGRRSEPDP